MRAVGVIGAGQMGAGIAQVSAAAGYHVYLSDLDLAKAEAGKASIANALTRLVAKEKMGQVEAAALLLRIEPVASYDPMADAGLIIEAATEREGALVRSIVEVHNVSSARHNDVKGVVKCSGQDATKYTRPAEREGKSERLE